VTLVKIVTTITTVTFVNINTPVIFYVVLMMSLTL
jgi:hypothetical protein